MNNRYFLSVLLLFTAAITNGQVAHSKHSGIGHSKGLLYKILSAQCNSVNASKTTTSGERLIGQADYITGPTRTDSLAMVYSGSRGSHFNFQLMDFVYQQAPDFLPVAGDDAFGYAGNSGILLPHNQAPQVYSDTTKIWALSSPAVTWGYFATQTHQYDTKMNLLDDQFIGAPGVIWQRDICTYNTSSNITSIIELQDNVSTGGLPWDSSDRADLFYNTSGQLVMDSISYFGTSGWIPSTKYVYSYDGSGRISKVNGFSWTSSWDPAGEDRFTYYSSGNLKVYEYYTGSTTLQLQYRDSFGYNPGIAYYTYLNAYSRDASGMFVDSTVSTRHVNTSGLPDTIYYDDYAYDGSLNTHDMDYIVYNSFHDPVRRMSYTGYTMSTPTIYSGQTNYYYAPYDNTETREVVEKTSLKIYPNPSTEMVYISLPDCSAAAMKEIAIYNSIGQKLRTEHVTETNQVYVLSLNGLNAGMYLISAVTNDGKIYQQQITKF